MTALAEMSSDDYVRPGAKIPESPHFAPPAPAAAHSLPQPPEPEVDRRSPTERLVDTRCGSCHSAALYARTGRTWLGWEVAVARMRLFNGAELAGGERGVIVRHLTKHRGAPLARAVAESAAGLALLGALAGLGRWGWRRRARR